MITGGSHTFFFFLLFRAVPKTYEGSQARGQTTATALWDLSHICNLYHSSWQSWIPKPLSKARDQTHIFIDTSWIHFHCTTTGTPGGQLLHFFYFIILILKLSKLHYSYYFIHGFACNSGSFIFVAVYDIITFFSHLFAISRAAPTAY